MIRKNNEGYSLKFSDARVRDWTGSSLTKVMACRLFWYQAISRTNADIVPMGPLERNSVAAESKHKKFIWKKNAFSFSGLNVFICYMRGKLSQ